MNNASGAASTGALTSSELIGLLTEQRDLYGQLAVLAERQRSLITTDEAQGLLEVLARRQELIDRLQASADRLRPHFEGWRELRPRMTETDGSRADALLSEINGLLGRILAQDKEDAALLAARKSHCGEQAATVRKHKQVGAAYAAAGQGGSSRLEYIGR